MARPRSLDRGRLLDAAETIVIETGAAGLTFGSLASAAQVPKASIQSAFGSREALMDAVLDRWLAREQTRFDTELANRTSDRDRMLAHIRITAELTREESISGAALMAALAGSGLAETSFKGWYRARAGTLEATTSEARVLRIAFLAAEGAYYLRNLFSFPMSDRLWHEIFDDLHMYAEHGQATVHGAGEGAEPEQ
jgi:AcrR family transcriptional regulator